MASSGTPLAELLNVAEHLENGVKMCSSLMIPELSQTESNTDLLGPPEKCVLCGEEVPSSTIKNHSDECTRLLQSSDEVRMAVTEEDSHPQDVRQQGPSTLEIPQGPAAAPEIVDLVSIEESGSAGWKIEPDPSEAAERFKEGLFSQHETEKTLSIVLDLGDSAEERTILSFYKMAHVNWTSPLTCTLKKDPATSSQQSCPNSSMVLIFNLVSKIVFIAIYFWSFLSLD
ncbi:hypothetical protein AMECASPLE_035849 [Ameca splendens]|uniref:Uncharacterized protein n=1 Tax=Ameca splendens TaxID=208324 RepID=A0ABV0XKJ2_9TELE